MKIIEDVLTKEELTWLKSLVANGHFDDGKGSAGGVAGAAKQNQQLKMTSENGQKLAEMVIAALQRNTRFFRTAMPIEISMPMISRYAPGMHYGLHYDSAIFSSMSGHWMRADLSVTLFLSDPDKYDGGELVDTKSGKRVKIGAGSLVTYPTGGLHEVTPVTRGTRYAIIFWVQSMVSDHTQRALLASLDDCVERVAAKIPGSEEVRELGGIFSNLGRMWINP